MKKLILVFLTLLLTTILTPGCTAITSTPTTSSTSPSSDLGLPDGMGRLVVNVTDPPPPDMERVIVEVENLEVHKAGGTWTTVAKDMEPFDLKLLEDRVDLLATAIVDEGIYTQIRLDIKSVTIWVTGDETPHEARVPSGKIKLVGSFEVVDGEETEVTLDFIGAESVIVTGNGEYIFKPVIKLLIPKSAKPGNGKEETLSAALETSETGALIDLVSDPDPVYSGDESIRMVTTGMVGVDGSEARIVILMPEGTILNDIGSISWWAWTVTGYPPHVDLVLDVNEDTLLDDVDMLTAEMAYNNFADLELDGGLTPTLEQWLQTFELSTGDGYSEVNNSTMLWVTKMGAGNDDAPWGTLAQWKDGIVFDNPEPDGLLDDIITGEAKVLRIEIEVDNWVLQTEAFVDGIVVILDGEPYSVEF
jgi:hypothetical protein